MSQAFAFQLAPPQGPGNRGTMSPSDIAPPRPPLARQLLQSHRREGRAMMVSLACSVAQVALTIANVSVVRSVIDNDNPSRWRAMGVAALVFALAIAAVVARRSTLPNDVDFATAR